MHDVTEVFFDVDPYTNDVVVASRVTVNTSKKDVIYFVKESSCSVQWVFESPNGMEGILYIAFDPLSTDRIYGLS